jgi:GT2 family glycosyltransferase
MIKHIRQAILESRIIIEEAGCIAWTMRFVRYLKKMTALFFYDKYMFFIKRGSLSKDEMDFLKRDWEDTGGDAYPCFSLILPFTGKNESLFIKVLTSLKRQIYPKWQLLLVAGHGTIPDISRQGVDSRIKTIEAESDAGVNEFYNIGINHADGEYIAFIQMNYVFPQEAFDHVVRAIKKHPVPDIIYTDEDKINILGKRKDPLFLPDYAPAHFLQILHRIHFIVYSKSLVMKTGGIQNIHRSAQLYDFALRACEHARSILHIPRILCHITENTHLDWRQKHRMNGIRMAVVQAALKRRNICADISIDTDSRCQISRRPHNQPLVSIIIPMRDKIYLLKKLLQTFKQFNTYDNYEIVIVDNGSQEEETIRFLDSISSAGEGVSIVYDDGDFNFSRLINIGVKASKGSLLLLLNNDIEFTHPYCLEPMISYAEEEDVGAVGALLFYPDGTIQHAGVGVGIKKGVQHLFAGKKYKTIAARSNRSIYLLDREVSVVTAACMMIRREVYHRIGGLDEEKFKVSFNDVDLCLRLRAEDYRIVMCATSRFIHHESKSRARIGDPVEIANLKKIWRPDLYVDPYINPNYSRDNQHFMLGEAWKISPARKDTLVLQKIMPVGRPG